MDHAVKATRGRPWNTLRFENDELECLYQRYTLKLQRFSVLGVVALVVVLCGVMAALSFVYNYAATFHVSFIWKKGGDFWEVCFFFNFEIFLFIFFAECLQFVCVPLICHNFNFIAMSRDQGSSFALSMLWHSIIYCCHLFRFDANTGFHISG